MAITTYAELQTSVKNWLHRSDMDAVIPDLITLGEGRIYRQLRVRQMEETLSGTFSGGTLAIPADYVELKFAYVDTSSNRWLERKTAEWIYRNDPTRSSGEARYIAREGSNFILSPTENATIAGIYYKRLDPIATTLNTIFTSHPGLWLFAALIESEAYIVRDARMPMWEAKFGQLVQEVSMEEWRENASGSNLAMTAE
jgi:hypothetical protein